MPGAALADPGLTTWTDNVDNWRAADADYLQKRSNMRFATVAARTTALGATPVPGMVSYVLSTDTLQYTDAAAGTTNVWRTVLAPVNLAVSDTLASFGLRLASDGAASMALEAGKVVLGPARVLIVDSGVHLKTGAATANLTTDATALVSDVQLKAPSAALTGALASASIANTGAITTASVTASGNIQAATLNVSGTSTLAAITATSLTASGTVSAATATATTVNGGNIRLTGNTVANSVTGGVVTITADIVATGGQVVLAPSGGPARFGTTAGPYIACSVANAADPGVANYPEGTFWAQV